MRTYLRPAAMVFAFGIAASPVYASTLTADGITYSLTDSAVSPTKDQFTLTITGINGSSDTEKGRFGVESFAFNPPSPSFTVTAPAGFTEQSGGLNSGGCDGNGNFFCFLANTDPTGPALAANSTLTFVFDVTLSSGTFAGYDPDFKINWDGTKNNYDLVSQALAPTDPPLTATPLPGALPLFAGGLALVGFVTGRRKRSALSIFTAA
jgi:hypothetical protein